MMRRLFKTGTAIALLALTACSPKIAMDETSVAAVEAPAAVIMAEPATLERKGTCAPTDIEDGIGGTGCPAID